jgi:hypothetical protein
VSFQSVTDRGSLSSTRLLAIQRFSAGLLTHLDASDALQIQGSMQSPRDVSGRVTADSAEREKDRAHCDVYGELDGMLFDAKLSK